MPAYPPLAMPHHKPLSSPDLDFLSYMTVMAASSFIAPTSNIGDRKYLFYHSYICLAFPQV
jgi:hypothetical protein